MPSLEIDSAGIALLVATAKMRKKRVGAIDVRKGRRHGVQNNISPIPINSDLASN